MVIDGDSTARPQDMYVLLDDLVADASRRVAHLEKPARG